MNNIFFIALGIYLVVFIIISIVDVKKIKDFTDYAVAGRIQGTFAVTMSLLATMLGASTTIGLILQSLLISGKIRATEADTLPDLARITVSKSAEMIIALIIVISWIGVIAGQLVAMNSLIQFATGRSDKWLFVIISAIVILYTLLGGQSSVVRTDKLQAFIIVIGIILCTIYLYVIKESNTIDTNTFVTAAPANNDFKYYFTQFFVVGGVFFLGPDIISRNFISRDEDIAKKSALWAGIGLFIFSIFIALIGVWAKNNISLNEMQDSKALFYIANMMPVYIKLPLIFGLLSAILSSTDTCLINASSIFAKDIIRKEDVRYIRITVAVIGILATVLAVWGRGDIMSLLTGAYSIYTPGIIFPLLIAILCYSKNGVKTGIWITAVVLGGLCGLMGTYFGSWMNVVHIPAVITSNLTLIGMGISLVVSLLSIKRK